MTSTKTSKGFTLIELMIAVAVIAILASIAIPNYTEYVVRSKLVKGVQPLAELKIRMNQWFDDNGLYVLAVGSVSCGVDNEDKNMLSARYDSPDFTYACVAEQASTTDATKRDRYTVTATSRGSLGAGTYVYAVNQNGAQTTVAHPNGANANCWLTSGACQ